MDKTTAQPKKFKLGLSNNQVKIIAMLSMFIDHLGVQIFPTLDIFRIIGRLSLPLFAYMIAEGCLHTRNRTKYLLLISSLGIACQSVFYIVEQSLYQGILITFSLSILLIFSIDKITKTKNAKDIIIGILGVGAVIVVALVLPSILKNQGFRIDYGIVGILMPVAIYYAPNKILKLLATTVMLALLIFTIGTYQHYAFISLPLLALYNGKRGTKKLKYVFYAFYPLHLVIIYLLSFLI